MAQINLLKQKSPGKDVWKILLSLSSKLLIALLLGTVAYYAWLFYQEGRIKKDIVATEQKIAENKNTIIGIKDRDEVLTRQLQVKELEEIMANHLYWSGVLPELAKVTLKKAKYFQIKALADGSITMSVSLPSLEDLDKYMQVFNLPDVVENFSDVSVGSFHRVPSSDNPAVNFDVKMKFNTALLHQPEGEQ